MVLTYILPLVCMGFTYVRIGHTLWGSRSIGEQTPRMMESIRSKRKVRTREGRRERGRCSEGKGKGEGGG